MLNKLISPNDFRDFRAKNFRLFSNFKKSRTVSDNLDCIKREEMGKNIKTIEKLK